MDLRLRGLISKCYEGDKEECKKAFDELEGSLRRKANADDFPPHLNPTIAACLGKRIVEQ